MSTSDLQSGVGASRGIDGTLRGFTSACGQSFFRGDRLGGDVIGDYFVCEPSDRVLSVKECETSQRSRSRLFCSS